MATIYYRYVDLQGANEYVPNKDYFVWYYQPNKPDPPRWTQKGRWPGDAFAAIVATPDAAFQGGDALGAVVFIGDKDPVPPPPPPPWRGDMVAYLKQYDVEAFFLGAPRSTHVE